VPVTSDSCIPTPDDMRTIDPSRCKRIVLYSLSSIDGGFDRRRKRLRWTYPFSWWFFECSQ